MEAYAKGCIRDVVAELKEEASKYKGIKFGTWLKAKKIEKACDEQLRNSFKKYKVVMIFPEDDWAEYPYGTYEDGSKANEVAMWVRDTRGCFVKVVEVDN